MKKPSSRGQRGSKGIKGKHFVQICVLLGVCIWLMYQVKYSHDKKKELYEKDGKKSSVLLSESEDGLVKLGRKDLPGKEKHVEEDEDEEGTSHVGEEKESKLVDNNNHEEEKEEDEEEEVVEEDEEDKNKQEEEVVEEDEEENKHEEDEIDEQDQNKTFGDPDKEDEFLEEEKETSHADEIGMSIDEAREEQYKADDASSAVSHESRMLNSEKSKESSGNLTEKAQENNVNATIEIQKEPFLKLEEAERGEFMNKTTTQLKDGDSESSSSETKDSATESQGDTVNGNSTVSILEASGFLQKETQIMPDRSQEDDAPPAGFSDLKTVLEVEQTRNESNPKITVSTNITNKVLIQDESRNSTSETSLLENSSGSNTTEVKESSMSEGDDESGSNLSSTEQTEEADDTSENSISQEEMEALTDPLTLPDIRTEGSEEDEEEAIAAE